MKKLTDGRRTQRAMWAKKGDNYRENQVLQANSKGSGHYLWESMIK